MLKIEWQRLIINKETCPRCGGTEQELEKAVRILADQGIKVKLLKREIGEAEFSENPRASNKIIINGKTIEEWLTAKTGSSPCCEACGDNDCRTVELNDQAYETIPADLIVQAAIKAAKKR